MGARREVSRRQRYSARRPSLSSESCSQWYGYGYQLYGLYFGPHQYENIPVFTADAIYVNGDTIGRLDRECRGVTPDFVSRFTDLFGE